MVIILKRKYPITYTSKMKKQANPEKKRSDMWLPEAEGGAGETE